jgi:hypothetical protein
MTCRFSRAFIHSRYVLGHKDDFRVAICDHNMQGSESRESVANSFASYHDWDVD